MNLEFVQRQVRREGVAFPRLSLVSRSNTETTGSKRIFMPSDTGQVVWEDGYNRFFSLEGVREERGDMQHRTETAIRFLVEVGREAKAGVSKSWQAALENLRSTSTSSQEAITLLKFAAEVKGHTDILRDYIIEDSLRLGAQLETYSALGRLRKLIPQAGFRSEIERMVHESLDLVCFYDLGTIVVPMPNLSVADIMDDKTWRSIGPDKLFKFFIECNAARRNVDLDRIFPQDYTFAKTHPQTTMFLIHEATFALNHGFSLVPEGLNSVKKIPSMSIAQRGMNRFANRIAELKGIFFATFFNPESEDFPAFSETVAQYLNGGNRTESIIALNRMGLDQGTGITDPYRRARSFVMAGNNPDLFDVFSRSVKDLVEEGRISQVFYVPTYYDLTGILEEEKMPGSSIGPEVHTAMAARISNVFKIKNIREHTFDPASIDWDGLVPPQEVTIKFQPKPHKFLIELIWRNQEGESLNVNLNFDTKGNKLDWNFLESPDDPVMISMRTSSFATAQNILKALEDDIVKQAEDKKSPKSTQTALLPKGAKRERSDDESYRIRKQVKEEARNARVDVTGNISFEPDSEIKKVILMPEQDKLLRMLNALGAVDQRIVQNSLEDFNKRGTGKFTRKRLRDGDGEPLYTLAIGCTAPKGARVLLKESSNSSGLRTFEIIDIRYRKDIYRRAGI